jgi:methionyl aminopeptidase
MIKIRNSQEVEKIKRAGKIVAIVLKSLKNAIRPGIRTKQLEDLAVDIISKHGAISAFKDYEGYSAHICTSVNEEIVHAKPSERSLIDGDIISIDVGVNYDGFFADAATTVLVGRVDPKVIRLVRVTEKALSLGISKARPGNFVSDISHAIESFVAVNGYSVVREFVGHGIGEKLHEEPQIPNFGQPHLGPELKEGMVLAIEPMVNMGVASIEILADGWTAVTKDKMPSAHFEHTIVISKHSNFIATK